MQAKAYEAISRSALSRFSGARTSSGSDCGKRSKDPWVPNREEVSRGASLRICLSSVRSETARRSRSFSFSSSFRRRSRSTLISPYSLRHLERDPADPELTDCLRHRHTLPVQDFRLPQQAHDFLRPLPLPCHRQPSSFRNLTMDQFDGGGSRPCNPEFLFENDWMVIVEAWRTACLAPPSRPANGPRRCARLLRVQSLRRK